MLNDVVEYLFHPRRDIICEAISILLNYSGNENFLELFDNTEDLKTTHEQDEIINKLVKRLINLSHEIQTKELFQLLVNISAASSKPFARGKIISMIIDVLFELSDFESQSFLAMCLSNITRDSLICSFFAENNINLLKLVYYSNKAVCKNENNVLVTHLYNTFVNLTNNEAVLHELFRSEPTNPDQLLVESFIDSFVPKNLLKIGLLILIKYQSKIGEKIDEKILKKAIHSTCLFLYPSKSYLETLSENDLKVLSKEQKCLYSDEACGPTLSEDFVSVALDFIHTIVLSKEGRSLAKELEVYEVLRTYHIITTSEESLTKIEDFIHLTVMTESELDQK